MELNESGKSELRRKVYQALEDLPYGTRVHIDKNILESLLFKKIVYNRDTGETLKLPVWSGDFLRKIDLSEVDFEDVAWSLVVREGYDFPEEEFKDFMDEKTYEEIEDILPILDDEETVNYSNTNARIDFTKSFDYKKKGRVCILFCDFSFVDLSNNTLDDTANLYECNLANTKINTQFNTPPDKFGQIASCDLTNVKINGLTMDILKYADGYEVLDDCVLTNTGVNFTFDLNSKYIRENALAYRSMIEVGHWKSCVCNALPNIAGCFINGKRVLSDQEILELRESKKEEYKAYKRDLITSVTEDLKKSSGLQ